MLPIAALWQLERDGAVSRLPQWNAIVDSRADGRAMLGVNLENARSALAHINPAEVAAALAGLADVVAFRATHERYYGPGRRAQMPLMDAAAADVTAADLAYLADLAEKSKPSAVHITVAAPMWRLTETRHRAWYSDVIASVRESLQPMRTAFDGT